MSLIKEFEKTGNWLFRWRSYLPVVLLAVPLLAMDRYEYFENNEELNNLWQWVCLGVSTWGLLIRIFTICHTPEATSGRNTKEQIAETLLRYLFHCEKSLVKISYFRRNTNLSPIQTLQL